jgi:hypothetical protein
LVETSASTNVYARVSGFLPEVREIFGLTFFQGPSDINLMAAGARSLLDPLGKSGIDPKKQPLY